MMMHNLGKLFGLCFTGFCLHVPKCQYMGLVCMVGISCKPSNRGGSLHDFLGTFSVCAVREKFSLSWPLSLWEVHGLYLGKSYSPRITKYLKLKRIPRIIEVQFLALHRRPQESHHTPENVV